MLRALGDYSCVLTANSVLLVAASRQDLCCLQQKRWRRRTLKRPSWVPIAKDNTVEDIDKGTKDLLQQITEQNINACPSWTSNVSTPLLQKTWSANAVERNASYTLLSRRVGLVARKLGMVPQWLNDGTRVLCTMLEFPDNQVVSAIDPDTWFRYSIIGKRKAFGRFGPMWLVMVGAVNADPSQFTTEYRRIFNRQDVPVKEVVKGFMATEDAVVPPGTSLHVCHFNIGQYVSVSGKTIDWGFQGVVRRWGMRGQPMNGTTKSHRRVGAIGAKGEAKVWPGRRLPGHMGYEWVTIPSLEVLRIIPEKQVMYIKGSVPGEIGDFVMVNDTMTEEKRVKDPPFPTFIPTFSDSGEIVYDEYLKKLSDTVVMEDGQMYAQKMFRFTSPSVVFTAEHETKPPGRDKSRAKLAKVKK